MLMSLRDCVPTMPIARTLGGVVDVFLAIVHYESAASTRGLQK